MKFLIDTSVWSEALRRRNNAINDSSTVLSRLILAECDIYLTGIVLQEILSGITDKKLFQEIFHILSGFPYVEASQPDFVFAAELRNLLKTKGISAGSFDFLIASIAIRNNFILVTTDNDFRNIAKHTKLELFDFNDLLRNGKK
jgi:predicted nucleic acid-binding protein